jgi:hypothetical protein
MQENFSMATLGEMQVEFKHIGWRQAPIQSLLSHWSCLMRRGANAGFALTLLVMAGCATTPPPSASQTPVALGLAAFSAAKPGETLPENWKRTPFTRFKKPTEYRLASLDGRTVLASTADGSASLLVHDVSIDLKQTPWLTWRWKVSDIIHDADNTVPSREDSPARVIIGFEGDRDQLDFTEKLFHDQVRMLTGVSPPYATLMYIWENRKATGEVVDNVHTSRVKMIVAQTGAEGVGKWQDERWNVYDDFKRAFNEEPPKVKFVAVMSDSDNTRTLIHAFFGDIAFAK